MAEYIASVRWNSHRTYHLVYVCDFRNARPFSGTKSKDNRVGFDERWSCFVVAVCSDFLCRRRPLSLRTPDCPQLLS